MVQIDPQHGEELLAVTFKSIPIVNKKESKEKGRPIYDDVEHCEIKSGGNSQTVWCFPAHEQSPHYGTDPVTGERVRLTYAEKFNAQYKSFKNGGEQLQSGTPLSVAEFLSTGKILELRAFNIYTVEALAALDGGPLKQLGMGGRDMKNKAMAYLEQATGPAAVAVQQEVLSEMEQRNRELQAELDALRSGKPATTQEPASPFSDFEDEDIRNWLTDNGVQVDGRWKRETLISKADDVNAELAKKNEAVAA